MSLLKEVTSDLKKITQKMARAVRDDSGELNKADQAFVRNVLKEHMFTAIGALEYLVDIREGE